MEDHKWIKWKVVIIKFIHFHIYDHSVLEWDTEHSNQGTVEIDMLPFLEISKFDKIEKNAKLIFGPLSYFSKFQ